MFSSVESVDKGVFHWQRTRDMREYILERNHTVVRSVGNHLVGNSIFQDISSYILNSES